MATVTGKLNQNMRPHVWFFAVSDCDGELKNAFPNFTNLKLEVTMHLLDEGSEFSMEDKGSLQWVGVLAIIEISMFFITLSFCIKDFRRNEEYDLPLIVVIVVLALEALHNVCFFIHLLNYSRNGVGLVGLVLISEVL